MNENLWEPDPNYPEPGTHEHRALEAEAKLLQFEYATGWLEATYPDIYEEWLEEYNK